MFSKYLKTLSILKKFLFINFVIFTIIGLFTFIYLNNIQPSLIKKKSQNHTNIINNTIDNILRLDVKFQSDDIRRFLFSTRFIFQNLDRVIFFDDQLNLIVDTDTLDLDPRSFSTRLDKIEFESLDNEETEKTIEEKNIKIDEKKLVSFKDILKNYSSSENLGAPYTFMQEGLNESGFDKNAICLLTSRKDSMAMLNLEKYINLIIPRGSNELVKFIQENTRIPVLGHADGICHLFIDTEANLEMALSVALDSKIQYPAACNAIETLLVHKDIAPAFLEKAIPLFNSNDVKLIGDKRSVELGLKYEASLEDWKTEYLDLILSIKIVDDLEDAITHIQKYSSKHTDGIITENLNTANKFMNVVDSAGVFHNCSTRFADGFRYGFGAEVGISTQTLPPRGPVGLEGLVTYKYFLKGDGNLVDDFSSGKAIYTHKDF